MLVMLVISLIPKKCSAIFNADGSDVGDVGVVNDDGGNVGDAVDTQEVQSLQQPHCPPLSPEK